MRQTVESPKAKVHPTQVLYFGCKELTGLGGSPGLVCTSGLNGGRCMATGIPGFGPH